MIYIANAAEYYLPLPEGHRFPMIKYKEIPRHLIESNFFSEQNFFVPSLEDELLLSDTHSQEYINKLFFNTLTDLEAKRIGFPYSKEMVEREIAICKGTTEAAVLALEHRVSFNVAGGTHHAYPDHGEGYCIFNDIASAANYLRRKKLAKRILIVDLDVHQGNGTAFIFKDTEDVFTFSVHTKKIFPLKKEKSDLDIDLPKQCSDKDYLTLVAYHLPKVIKQFKPDFIFYQAGVDILHTDKLGFQNISIEGIKKRDAIVFEQAISNKIPITACAGGGYSENIQEIILAHCNTYFTAYELLANS